MAARGPIVRSGSTPLNTFGANDRVLRRSTIFQLRNGQADELYWNRCWRAGITIGRERRRRFRHDRRGIGGVAGKRLGARAGTLCVRQRAVRAAVRAPDRSLLPLQLLSARNRQRFCDQCAHRDGPDPSKLRSAPEGCGTFRQWRRSGTGELQRLWNGALESLRLPANRPKIGFCSGGHPESCRSVQPRHTYLLGQQTILGATQRPGAAVPPWLSPAESLERRQPASQVDSGAIRPVVPARSPLSFAKNAR